MGGLQPFPDRLCGKDKDRFMLGQFFYFARPKRDGPFAEALERLVDEEYFFVGEHGPRIGQQFALPFGEVAAEVADGAVEGKCGESGVVVLQVIEERLGSPALFFFAAVRDGLENGFAQ